MRLPAQWRDDTLLLGDVSYPLGHGGERVQREDRSASRLGLLKPPLGAGDGKKEGSKALWCVFRRR